MSALAPAASHIATTPIPKEPYVPPLVNNEGNEPETVATAVILGTTNSISAGSPRWMENTKLALGIPIPLVGGLVMRHRPSSTPIGGCT